MSTSDVATARSPVLSSEDRSTRIAVTVLPLLILAVFAIAMITPDMLKPPAPGANWTLGIITFDMGLTLTLPDFGLIIKCPLPVLVDVVTQYLIVPLAGWVLCYMLSLSDAVTVDVILIGYTSGGTVSNVASYLAKVGVTLSVTMASISTLLAPLMMPLFTTWLAGDRIPVNGMAMAKNILPMVLAPVLGGFTVRLVVGRPAEKALPLLPWISVFGICYALLVVMSGSVNRILTPGILTITAVICHNLLGYLFNYLAGRAGHGSDKTSRTTAVEVDTQNSALAATLAKTHFAFALETTLPVAVFSARHNLSGTLLAIFSRCWENGGQA